MFPAPRGLFYNYSTHRTVGVLFSAREGYALDHPTQALINFASDGREVDNLDAREIRATVRDGKIRPPTNLVQRKNKQWGRSHSVALSGIFLEEDGSPWYLHQWTECGTGDQMKTLERSEQGEWRL